MIRNVHSGSKRHDFFPQCRPKNRAVRASSRLRGLGELGQEAEKRNLLDRLLSGVGVERVTRGFRSPSAAPENKNIMPCCSSVSAWLFPSLTLSIPRSV